MLRAIFLLVATFAAPAQAAELWCMPDTICRNGTCRATTDTEQSVRLHDHDSATPVLRSDAEDIPMTRTHDGALVQWEGTNDSGRAQVLAMRVSDMRFTFVVRDGAAELRRATGLCEVQ